MLAKRDVLASCPPNQGSGLLFYGVLNDGFKGLASGVVVLRVEYPGAEWGRLIGQRVEAIGGDDGLSRQAVWVVCELGSRVCGVLLLWQQCLWRLGVLRSLWIFSLVICSSFAGSYLGTMFPISYQLHHTGMVTKRNHLLGYEPLTKSEAWEEQAKRLNRCWIPMELPKIS